MLQNIKNIYNEMRRKAEQEDRKKCSEFYKFTVWCTVEMIFVTFFLLNNETFGGQLWFAESWKDGVHLLFEDNRNNPNRYHQLKSSVNFVNSSSCVLNDCN